MTGRGNVGVLSLRLTRLRVVVLVACLAAFAVTFAQPAAADSGSGSTTTAASDPSTTASSGTADSSTTDPSLDVHAFGFDHHRSDCFGRDRSGGELHRPLGDGFRGGDRPVCDGSERRRRIRLPPARIRPRPTPPRRPRPRATRARPFRQRGSAVVTDPTAPSASTPPRRHHHDRHDDGRDGAEHHRQPSRPILLLRRRPLSQRRRTRLLLPRRRCSRRWSCRRRRSGRSVVHHRKAAAPAQFVRLVPTPLSTAPSTVHMPPDAARARSTVAPPVADDLLRLRDGRLAHRCRSSGGRHEHGLDACTEVALAAATSAGQAGRLRQRR